MTDQTELNYRIQERLGMLCGKSEPTEQQRKQATKEALDDLKRIELNEVTDGWKPLSVCGQLEDKYS